MAAFCLALGAGCAVGPDYRPPETKVPEKWDAQAVVTKEQPSKTSTAPVTLVAWWNAFNDPSLSSLVEMAIRSNLDLRQAEARILQARASRGVAGAPLLPEVAATALYQKSQGSSEAAGGGAIATVGGVRELFQVGLDASWELDIFGGTRRSIEAATADLKAAVEDRRDVLITLVGDVGTNYFNLRGFQQQIVIARKNLEAQKKTARITHKRFEAGFVSRLDVANADAQVATTEAQIPLLESQARAAIYSLGVLLGRQPAFLAKDLAVISPIAATPPTIPVGLPSDLVRRRPDIRRAEARLHAATARIGVATADLFPKFNLTGSLGISADDLTKIGNVSSSKFWSFSPSVTWPVFAGGRIRWNIKLQDALQAEALAAYEKTVLTALQDVETALVAYAKEQEHYRSLAAAVASNRQAVDLSMKLYLAGRTDFLNVLTAQRSLYVTEDALTQSTRTLATNLIALYKALGGGWEKANYLPASG
ncbi:MAG: efflux transporter outer membrane subunit [Syntrophales bacterium]|nr:efflux transporter outer membrane subunit [Syntrophales bacterium]MDD5642446.1 efflux transporter outer membrane subunit [Syntrophales bacterium]